MSSCEAREQRKKGTYIYIFFKTELCAIYLPPPLQRLVWVRVKSEWLQAINWLTEVVGHHGGRRWGRLGELLSPTALLLQVLLDHKIYMNFLAFKEKDLIMVLLFYRVQQWHVARNHAYLTSVLTSRTDLKSLDMDASLDCEQRRHSYVVKTMLTSMCSYSSFSRFPYTPL